MEPFAFAVPVNIYNVSGSTTQVDITFHLTAGDGTNNPLNTSFDFNWDATLPVATNLANLKAAAVSACALFNITELSSNVNVLMAVS